jgi:hypothetical protein
MVQKKRNRWVILEKKFYALSPDTQNISQNDPSGVSKGEVRAEVKGASNVPVDEIVD